MRARSTTTHMATYRLPVGGSIFVSVDHGVNFTKSEDIGGPVLSIAQDPFRENVLYAGGAGVFTSLDGGTRWRPASAGLTVNSVSALAADPVRPGYVYAATEQGVFRTVDGAHRWEPFSAGLASAIVSTLAISPDGSRLHAGTAGGGVYD